MGQIRSATLHRTCYTTFRKPFTQALGSQIGIQVSKIKYTLCDDFELRGIWWLPDNADQQISGVLTFKSEGKIRLELIGSFKQLPEFGKKEIEKKEIILGITSDGRLCTLVNCHESNSTLNFPGISCQIFEANYLLEGSHWNSKDEIEFEKISIGFDHLEEWLGHYPIKTNIEHDENNKNIGFTVKCDFPSTVEYYINYINSKFSTSYGAQTKDASTKTTTLEFNSFLDLQPDKSKKLDWYNNQLFVIQQLLTLLIGNVTYPNKLVATKSKKDKEFVNLFWTQSDKQKKNKLIHQDMIITLPEMRQEFCSVLEKWFSNQEELESTYNLFFGALFNSSQYLNFHFLSLMQAIETYHRQVFSGKYIEQKKYDKESQKIKTNMPTVFPSDLKDAIKSRIKYGNEYSLRKRIKGLFESTDESTRVLVTDDYKSFISKIVDTRNYFTHYDEELKLAALSGSELYYACQRLKIFIIILLLKSNGLNEEIIRNVIQRNTKIQPWG